MLEKPHLADADLRNYLEAAYGLQITELDFLPLGADSNTAVYRAEAVDGLHYFVKLRKANFDQVSVVLPSLLHDQGANWVIAPFHTTTGQLWGKLADFTVMLYPYIVGEDGFSVPLSEQQWAGFGAALKQLHSTSLPPELQQVIQRESFSDQYREQVRSTLAQLDSLPLYDEVSQQVVAFLREHTAEFTELIERAERLAAELQAGELEYVVCHFDIHAGNLLIEQGGHVYIVDWDTPLLAPKERDLMFIGGAQGFSQNPEEEERLFYAGYGEAQIDYRALAYYRYERIIQDIAAYCDELVFSAAGGADRAQSMGYLFGNVRPGSTSARAHAAFAQIGSMGH